MPFKCQLIKNTQFVIIRLLVSPTKYKKHTTIRLFKYSPLNFEINNFLLLYNIRRGNKNKNKKKIHKTAKLEQIRE